MTEERRAGNTEILTEITKLGTKVDDLTTSVADNKQTIDQLIGGVKAGRWIIGTLIAVAAMFGLGGFSK